MVDRELLEILICPETKQRLHVAPPEVVDRLNQAIRGGSVVNRGGQSVAGEVSEGLVREDGTVLYPVRADIPIMLIDEGIPLPK